MKDLSHAGVTVDLTNKEELAGGTKPRSPMAKSCCLPRERDENGGREVAVREFCLLQILSGETSLIG